MEFIRKLDVCDTDGYSTRLHFAESKVEEIVNAVNELILVTEKQSEVNAKLRLDIEQLRGW